MYYHSFLAEFFTFKIFTTFFIIFGDMQKMAQTSFVWNFLKFFFVPQFLFSLHSVIWIVVHRENTQKVYERVESTKMALKFFSNEVNV